MSVLTVENLRARLQRYAEAQNPAKPARRWMRRIAAGAEWVLRAVSHVWRNRAYLTPIKLANMAAINVQCAMKTERVWGMPYRMKIEPTNICNTQCQLCPTGQGIKGRAKGKMDFERFTRLVDQLRRYLYTLDLSMWGDPLIVPDIFRMVRYAHDRGIWTYLSSNLHAFKPQKGQAEQLIRSGLDMLTCSLHGASQGTFAVYQPGKDFHTALEKVKAIVEAKQKLGSATPAIQLNFVVTKHNEHEVERFKALADSLGCRAVFSSPSLNLRFLDRDENLEPLGLSEEELRERVKQKMAEWLPNDSQYVIPAYQHIEDGQISGEQFNGRKTMDCHWPWKDSVINWDGSVVACCGVYESDYDMGNVFERPFREIWNGESYRMARRSFKRPVDEAEDVANPCRTCPGFMV